MYPWIETMYRTGIFSNFGPLVTRLEARYAKFLNVSASQVVSVANCTLGLEGALALSSAKSWLVPDFTFAATGLAVLRAGKRILLGDVKENSWDLSEDLLHMIDDDTGVLPVVPFGGAVEYHAWLGRKQVIIDAAASLGTQPDLSTLPSTWCVAFSLHATKVLAAGEGGLLVFGNVEEAKRFRMWTNFGFTAERTSIYVGTNAKMSEIHAAYALASLDSWENEREEWLDARARAKDACVQLGLSANLTPRNGTNPYWIIDCGSPSRRLRLEQLLANSAIDSRRWWPQALHEMPSFSGCQVVSGGGIATDLSGRLLGLPMFRGLSAEEAKRVASVLKVRSEIVRH